jgi:nucleoside-diphosphate-sugar epimerase
MPAVNAGTVCILGAGGPVAAVSAELLAQSYSLRLVDSRSLEQILASGSDPRVPAHRPRWTRELASPHEWIQADVACINELRQAMNGCQAVINLTVNREDPELAFAVNSYGAYAVGCAAADSQIQRLVQTGPFFVWGTNCEGDCRYEFPIPDDAHLRPGTVLYAHTKHIGHELTTVVAQERGLDVLTLLFHRLRPHDSLDNRDDNVVIPYSTAWEDLGSALLCALRAPTLPRPNERFFICARMPMNKCSPDKAERLLGWKPRHDFERFYRISD